MPSEGNGDPAEVAGPAVISAARSDAWRESKAFQGALMQCAGITVLLHEQVKVLPLLR